MLRKRCFQRSTELRKDPERESPHLALIVSNTTESLSKRPRISNKGPSPSDMSAGIRTGIYERTVHANVPKNELAVTPYYKRI